MNSEVSKKEMSFDLSELENPFKCFQLISLVEELQNNELIIKPVVLEDNIELLCQQVKVFGSDTEGSITDYLFLKDSKFFANAAGLFGPSDNVKVRLQQFGMWPKVGLESPNDNKSEGVEGLYVIVPNYGSSEVNEDDDRFVDLLLFSWMGDDMMHLDNLRGIPTLMLRWMNKLTRRVMFCMNENDLDAIQKVISQKESNFHGSMEEDLFSFSMSITKRKKQADNVELKLLGKSILPREKKNAPYDMVSGAFLWTVSKSDSIVNFEVKQETLYQAAHKLLEWFEKTSLKYRIEIDAGCPVNVLESVLKDCNLYPHDLIAQLQSSDCEDDGILTLKEYMSTLRLSREETYQLINEKDKGYILDDIISRMDQMEMLYDYLVYREKWCSLKSIIQALMRQSSSGFFKGVTQVLNFWSRNGQSSQSLVTEWQQTVLSLINHLEEIRKSRKASYFQENKSKIIKQTIGEALDILNGEHGDERPIVEVRIFQKSTKQTYRLQLKYQVPKFKHNSFIIDGHEQNSSKVLGKIVVPEYALRAKIISLKEHLAMTMYSTASGQFELHVQVVDKNKLGQIIYTKHFGRTPQFIDYDPIDRSVLFVDGSLAVIYKFNERFNMLEKINEAKLSVRCTLGDIKGAWLFGGKEHGLYLLDESGFFQFFNLRSKQISAKEKLFPEVENLDNVVMEKCADSNVILLFSLESIDNDATGIVKVQAINVINHSLLPVAYIDIASVRDFKSLIIKCCNNMIVVCNRVTKEVYRYNLVIQSGSDSWHLTSFNPSDKNDEESKQIIENSHWICAMYHSFEKYPVRGQTEIDSIHDVVPVEEDVEYLFPVGPNPERLESLKKLIGCIMQKLNGLQKPLHGLNLSRSSVFLRNAEEDARAFLFSGSMDFSSWLQEILAIVPIQLCRAEFGSLTLMSNGRDDFMHGQNHKEAFQIAEEVRFGPFSQILESWQGHVIVVTSMGKQSTGKSYFLNHLTGSSYSISGARCTDGVWMSLKIFENSLLVILDFEGLGSFERTVQEDVFLSVLNASISSLTIFRIETRMDKDIDSMFRKFQEGIQLIKGDDRLFRGKILFSVKDVNPNDAKSVVSEFSSKLGTLLTENKENNFVTEMYNGNLEIHCSPPLGSEGYFRAMEKARNHLRLLQADPKSGFINGETFLDCLKLILAKISILDWTNLDESMARLKMMQVNRKFVQALKHGSIGSSSFESTPLNLKSGEVISLSMEEICEGEDELKFFMESLTETELTNIPKDETIEFGEENFIANCFESFVSQLKSLDSDSTHCRMECQVPFSKYLSFLIRRRVLTVTKWLKDQVDNDSSLVDQFKAQLKTFAMENTRCPLSCSTCKLFCLLPVGHADSESHDCKTLHQCNSKCLYCENSPKEDNASMICAKIAGHEGGHDCMVASHVCGQPCKLKDSPSCAGPCSLVVGHEGDHLCDSRHHSCGMSCSSTACSHGSCMLDITRPHTVHKCSEVKCVKSCFMNNCQEICSCNDHFHGDEELSRRYCEENNLPIVEWSDVFKQPSDSGGNTQRHMCSKTHKCPEMCEHDGICEVKVHLMTRNETFAGKRGEFQYAFQEMNGTRMNCAVELPPYQESHASTVAAHSCSQSSDRIHYCEDRCPCCEYYCNKPHGHSGSHNTSHGNMKNTYFVCDEEDFEVDDRQYSAGEQGIAEMCPLFCSKMGRGHVHFVPCESTGGLNSCVYGGGVGERRRHCELALKPNPAQPMDELLHDHYWNSLGWEDPCSSNADRTLFNKCQYSCDAADHEEAQGGQTSYCTLDAWHPPCSSTSPPGSSYSIVNGHRFECSHYSSSGRYHHIFVLDSSGSMGGLPWNNLISAVSQYFGLRRQVGRGNDIFSAISFDNSASIEYEAVDLDRAAASQISFRSGGTNFANALRTANGILSRNDHAVYTPVLLFFSDGGSSGADDICRHINSAYSIYNLKSFVIGFGSSSSYLNTVTSCLGGEYLNAVSHANLGTTFVTISASVGSKTGLVCKPSTSAVDSGRSSPCCASSSSSTSAPSSSPDECSICTDPLHISDSLLIPCGHIFHKSCLDQLPTTPSSGSKQCPLCRASFR